MLFARKGIHILQLDEPQTVGVFLLAFIPFLFFSLLYFFRLCAVLLFNYSEGGIGKRADL